MPEWVQVASNRPAACERMRYVNGIAPREQAGLEKRHSPEDDGVLGNDADALAQAVEGHGGRPHAVHQHVAPPRVQPEQRRDQRRLSCPGPAHDAHLLPVVRACNHRKKKKKKRKKKKKKKKKKK